MAPSPSEGATQLARPAVQWEAPPAAAVAPPHEGAVLRLRVAQLQQELERTSLALQQKAAEVSNL